MARRLIFLGLLLLLPGCNSLTGLVDSPAERAASLAAVRQKAAEFYEQGNYQRSVFLLTELIEQVPSDTNAWFMLGNSYARLNLGEEAQKAYREVLVRDSKHSKAWFNLVQLQVQELAVMLNDIRQQPGLDEPLKNEAEELLVQVLEVMDASAESVSVKDHQNSSDGSAEHALP